MSEQPSVIACLSTAMEVIRAVGKTGENKSQGYNFRGIDAVVNAASPAFRQVGVVVTPELRSIDYETVEVGSKRSLMQSCKVVVGYTFHGPAGDSVTAVAPGEAMDSGDKATAKAMSVAFRTALLQALCIPTTDTDPDEQSYERSPAREQAPGVTSKDAGDRLRDHLATQVEGDVTEHAKAVWRMAHPKAERGLIPAAEVDRLLAVADQYVADLREMHGEAVQEQGEQQELTA